MESGSILLYLAELTGRFLPADAVGRSRVTQWLMWQMAGVGPMIGQALHFRFIAPRYADEAGAAYGAARYTAEVERLYDVAERRLARSTWFGGNDYSIADMACFPWLGRSRTLEIDLSSRTAVRDWIARIEARPACLAIAEEGKALFKADVARQASADPADLARFFGLTR